MANDITVVKVSPVKAVSNIYSGTTTTIPSIGSMDLNNEMNRFTEIFGQNSSPSQHPDDGIYDSIRGGVFPVAMDPSGKGDSIKGCGIFPVSKDPSGKGDSIKGGGIFPVSKDPRGKDFDAASITTASIEKSWCKGGLRMTTPGRGSILKPGVYDSQSLSGILKPSLYGSQKC